VPAATCGQTGPVPRAADVDALLDRARALVRPGRCAVLGVVGSPGSGKSTLAEALVRALAAEAAPAGAAGEGPWVVHLPMDGYHLADVELRRLGRLSRKGAPDTFDPAGYAALLRRVRADAPELVYAPAFDRTIEQPVAGSIPVPPSARLVVTEGNYLLLDDPGWRPVRALLDDVWFCDVDEQVRLARLVARHTRYGKAPAEAVAWVERVDQPNARLVEATRERADLLVPDAVTTALHATR
jgi:pantothenate kinase